MKLYDAAACPYCARVRIVLAEKALDYETVEIDLRDRPAWIYDLNPIGRVPILDDGFVLPESAVIMEYLEERYPEPALLPADLGARARARLAVFRFDELLGDDYYAFRRGEPNALERAARRAAGRAQPLLRRRVRSVGAAGAGPVRLRAAFRGRRVGRRAVRAAVDRARARGGGGAVSEIELEELSRRLGEVTVVDVRHDHEYDGTLGAPCDPRQGHIPGARPTSASTTCS